MIDIKSISGELLLSVPILEDAVIHEELMASDYVALSWSSESDAEIPAGAYIEHGGERYSLLEPYRPERADEAEYKYKPQFHSRVMAWDKQPACVYTYEADGKTVKSREFDWSFVGSPADAMHIVRQAIKNEAGEEWSVMLSDSLPSSIEITGQASSILAVLSDIANQCETEYWADKRSNVLHLSKCEHGSAVALTVGDNVSVPSVTSNRGGYFTRYYALGSTRNITQAAGNINGSVNKRLTLDPNVYPMGYKDVKGHYENGVFVSDLQQGEIFSNVVIFDDIYPSSDLVIYDVRPRMKYKLDGGGNKVIIGGTEDAPVYDQYAVWYFKIRGFEFTNDLIIPNKKLSVHFKSGQLTGQEFELVYHDKASSVKDSGDVVRFEIEAGDYEILFKEEGDVILPSIAYLIPQEDNEVTLFNIEMPSEYTQSAMVRLEEALDKHMKKDAADSNTYEVSSNAVAFYEANTMVGVGQKIAFTNGGSFIETRTLMVERKLDFPCQQKIRVGNNLIKGSTKELRENVESLNKSVDVIAAFNDLSKTIQEGYARTQAQINEALAKQVKMFYFADDDTVATDYNFFAKGESSAGGQGEAVGISGGGGIDTDELEDILKEKGYATEGYVNEEVEKVKTDIKAKPSSYVPLKTINGLSLYGSGNINVEGSGGGSEGLTAINVNDESFQPDENGIVTLPDYPSALPNPKALTFGSKTYNGSAASTITETDIISDIDTIRAKLASLANYDDAEVKAAIAVLQGYFVGEKAKNADKLDGQDSRYFATASSVSNLSGTVSNLSGTVSNLSGTVTTLGEDMTDVKDRLATAESDITANEGNIESQGSDIASLKMRMTDAEGDIADNANGIKGNAEDITDLDRRLDSIESWYNNVGSKFSKDTDGTIKMNGDFYTTGENSAGGVGESVGGTGGGGIDTEELDNILDAKGYATEAWVSKQGYAKGTIPTMMSQLTNDKGYVTASDIPSVPTRVSQLENDANYLASITASMVKSALGYTPFNESNFSKMNIRTTLGISDWALATTKPTYSYSEIANAPNMSNYATTSDLDKKVDKVSGKGLSTNDYTTTEKNKLASLENYNDSELRKKVNETANEVQTFDGRISDLEDWYSKVGSKFSIDGTAVKVSADFYATGENSAGGQGENIGTGGGGGGLDESELEDYLTDNKYAKQSWVEEQGYAKGTIPTRVSQLDNDAKYLASITSAMVTAALGYAPFSAANFTKLNIKNTLGISDWALAASKPTYSYGEISNTPDLSNYATKSELTTLQGKVATAEANIVKNSEAIADHTQDIDEVNGRLDSLETWYNSVGSKFSKESDGSIKMTGDFFTTGENSAGGKGSEAFDLASVLDRLAALEDNAAKNLVINFTLLSSNIGESKLQTVLSRIGFTESAVNGLLDAKYNKVVGNGTYREVWNYTAHETATYIEIYLRKGDGNLVGEWYNLYYSKSTQRWNIIFGEI